MSERITFTKERLDAIKAPSAGRTVVHDTKTHGLSLRVTPAGAKTFSLFRRVKGGDPFRVTLGRYGGGGITIDQARRMAASINSKAAEGVSVADARRAHRDERTFAELFSEYLERHAKPQKRSWKEDRQRFEQYLAAPLGKKKLSAINRAIVGNLHSTITNAGHSTVANRVVALVSSVYGRAIEWGLVESTPVKGIRRNKERSRDRFLQSDELPRFLQALAAEPNDVVRLRDALVTNGGAPRQRVVNEVERGFPSPRRMAHPTYERRHPTDHSADGGGGDNTRATQAGRGGQWDIRVSGCRQDRPSGRT